VLTVGLKKGTGNVTDTNFTLAMAVAAAAAAAERQREQGFLRVLCRWPAHYCRRATVADPRIAL